MYLLFFFHFQTIKYGGGNLKPYWGLALRFLIGNFLKLAAASAAETQDIVFFNLSLTK